MALQEGGQISLGDIATEMGVFIGNISLATQSTTDINTNSTYKPDGSQPHSMSEFYGYDHNASAPAGLTPIYLMGPFGDTDSACVEGPNLPPQEYYYSGDFFGPGSSLFLDGFGFAPAEPNTAWYFPDENTSYFLEDSSIVAYTQTCRRG